MARSWVAPSPRRKTVRQKGLSDVSTRVCVIGISAGGADSLSPALQERIEKAEILAGGTRHLRYFPRFAGAQLRLQQPLDDWIEQVASAADAGREVVVLAS